MTNSQVVEQFPQITGVAHGGYIIKSNPAPRKGDVYLLEGNLVKITNVAFLWTAGDGVYVSIQKLNPLDVGVRDASEDRAAAASTQPAAQGAEEA